MVTTVFDIFSINPNTRPLFTFLPSPHGTRRRIQACGPNHGRHPKAARRRSCTADVLQGAKCTTWRQSSTHAHAPWTTSRSSCEKQGKLAEAGLMVFGVRGDVPGPFTKGILFGQGLRPGFFPFQFPPFLRELTHISSCYGIAKAWNVKVDASFSISLRFLVRTK